MISQMQKKILEQLKLKLQEAEKSSTEKSAELAKIEERLENQAKENAES